MDIDDHKKYNMILIEAKEEAMHDEAKPQRQMKHASIQGQLLNLERVVCELEELHRKIMGHETPGHQEKTAGGSSVVSLAEFLNEGAVEVGNLVSRIREATNDIEQELF